MPLQIPYVIVAQTPTLKAPVPSAPVPSAQCPVPSAQCPVHQGPSAPGTSNTPHPHTTAPPRVDYHPRNKLGAHWPDAPPLKNGARHSARRCALCPVRMAHGPISAFAHLRICPTRNAHAVPRADWRAAPLLTKRARLASPRLGWPRRLVQRRTVNERWCCRALDNAVRIERSAFTVHCSLFIPLDTLAASYISPSGFNNALVVFRVLAPFPLRYIRCHFFPNARPHRTGCSYLSHTHTYTPPRYKYDSGYSAHRWEEV